MANVIPQRELRNNNAAVMAAVEAGKTFVITRNGSPVAELRPIRPEQRTFVAKAVLAPGVAGGPPVDAATFRADLDRFVDPALSG
jgi:prevent-host-death family protein